MTNTNMVQPPPIRAASVLIENGHILLIKQEVTSTRHWALPGGKLEFRETLADCATRELKEETGLDGRMRELLYLTDRITENGRVHVVHMSFLVDRIGDGPMPLSWQHKDPHPSASSDTIREIRMVPIGELNAYGFSSVFCRLVKDGFPGRGSYKGDFHLIYGE